MVIFPVSPEKQSKLEMRMEMLGVSESDIKESFTRSSGKGGQHVNKTSTCVVLRHIPTGIETRCQNERSQSLNRYLARVTLLDKIESSIKGEESEERRRVAKIRRQKRKRSKRAEEKRLADKSAMSEKKVLRREPSGDDE